MSRPRIKDQEAGFLDSFWRELKVLEADYGAITTVMAHTSARPGVFTIRIEFTPISEKASSYIGRQAVVVEFPNGSTQTMAGALWAASRELTKQVVEAYDRVRAGRSFA